MGDRGSRIVWVGGQIGRSGSLRGRGNVSGGALDGVGGGGLGREDSLIRDVQVWL